MLVDSHAHLDSPQFDADREHVIRRALEANVRIISIATEMQSSWKTVEIARKYELRCTVGIHPHQAQQFSGEETLAQLRTLCAAPQVVAVGEIGLDYFKEYAPRATQQKALRAQLALAQELNKPVVIHLRDAAEDLLEILGEHRGVRGVVHSFTGDWALAQRLLALGFYLSVNGIVTFEKSQALREAVAQIPLERLLVETDAPYLAPVPMRGRRNEPSFVRYVAQTVAQIKRVSVDEVAEATTRNAQALFGF
ncbi:MAG: TatD family hydrolase [Candidatus Bipolaricaulota bacterium]|nr:TatD family hydrolase [Candidatus Bipolaricaulota bacterium]MCS7274377.1 TatD family hydrolase [Candidatus Bipolaricaulota bacterium]MDW8111558.1 TatD family hydrolase [Candidatus Bipolaricaulota bacterium]MDW8329797.1 TatD family hydrolase [Candidatus Bipolaricaulota bacterium]